MKIFSQTAKLPLFLILATAFVSPKGWAGDTAQLIFFGGPIVTMEPKLPEVEALAIQGGNIVATGSLSEVSKRKGQNTQMIDLKGKALLPGFFEPHGHPFDAAFAQFLAVDVRPFTVKDATALNQKIEASVRQAKPGDWVVFNGLDPLLQRGVTAPSLKQLDEWAPNNPLLIVNNSGHAAYANSLAFKAAGVTAQTPAPPGSRIVKDGQGRLTGTVEEFPAVTLLLEPVFKSLTPPQMVALLKKYQNYLASNGITTVSDMGFEAKSLPVYQAVASEPGAMVRVRLYEIARKDNQGALPPQGGDDMVRQNGVKWWVDGSPWLGTIATSKPYLNDDTTLKVMGLKPNNVGPLNYKDTAEFQAWVEAYFKQGYQIAIHAEGDVAIGQALEVMEQTLKNNPGKPHLMRVEHTPMITDAQLDKIAKLGIPTSFLMAHIYYWGDLLPKMFSEPWADRWNPTRSAQKRGIPFSFHNDGPVTPASPLKDFEIAQLRHTQGGHVLGPDQTVSIDEALRARTINAARELLMDSKAGSLTAGKWADLVVLSADPRKVKPEEVANIKVEATYLNGKQVWPSVTP